MKNSQEVIDKDLEYIYRNLMDEFKCLSGKRLLLTGGAGFLGYYLVQSILYWNKRTERHQHITLTVYDNFIRGVPNWLANVRGDEDLNIVKHDVNHPLPQNMEDFQFIIHAASIASPTYYRKYPIETMDANVSGLRILMEYCLRQKLKNKHVEGFLYFSTSEIYGDPYPENIPTPESYYGNVSCIGPRACYDESKRFGETMCVNFSKVHNLPVKIARPFNNFGPGLKITDRRVIPDFANDILEGKDIVMLSDGSPTRTFCYITDAIIGYYKILVRGHNGKPYNIGVEEPEISMAGLAGSVVNLARELFDYRGKVVHQITSDKNYLVDNPSRRCPQITQAINDLGYRPSISLDEGLRRSLIWYSDNRNAEEA